MSSKTVFENRRAELADASGKVYNVQLDLTVKEIYVDERATPVSRAIAETSLSHMSGMVVPDGRYTLTFEFLGKGEKHNVRVESGTLLAG
jgi:hypothetical protein